MVVQGLWLTDSTLLTLPHVDTHETAEKLGAALGVGGLAELFAFTEDRLRAGLRKSGLFPADDAMVSQIVRVVHRLPQVEVQWKLAATVEASSKDPAELHVDLALPQSPPISPQRSASAYAQRFPKPKKDGWIIVLGVPQTGELLALKRLTLHARSQQRVSLLFPAPPTKGPLRLVLYLMSDTYLGLNQQLDVTFEVV